MTAPRRASIPSVQVLPREIEARLAVHFGNAEDTVGTTFLALGGFSGALGLFPRFADGVAMRGLLAITTGMLSGSLARYALRRRSAQLSIAGTIFGGVLAGALNVVPATVLFALQSTGHVRPEMLLAGWTIGAIVGGVFGALYGMAYAPLLSIARARLGPSLDARDRVREACGVGVAVMVMLATGLARLVDGRFHPLSLAACAVLALGGVGLAVLARRQRDERRRFLGDAAAGRARGVRVRVAHEHEDLASLPLLDGEGAVLELCEERGYRDVAVPIARLAPVT